VKAEYDSHHHHHHHEGAHEPVAVLVRSIPVRLVEVSRGGCRLESDGRIESGTSGQLAVELEGVMRIDDVRVARCQPRAGAGPVFQLGAELLRTRRLGRRTVRMAVRKIIGEARAASLHHGAAGAEPDKPAAASGAVPSSSPCQPEGP
jgi:hypothetical protein